MSVTAVNHRTDTFGCHTAHDTLRQLGYVPGAAQVCGIIRIGKALSEKHIDKSRRVAEVARGILECVPLVSLVLCVVDTVVDYRCPKTQRKQLKATSPQKHNADLEKQLQTKSEALTKDQETYAETTRKLQELNNTLSEENRALREQVEALSKIPVTGERPAVSQENEKENAQALKKENEALQAQLKDLETTLEETRKSLTEKSFENDQLKKVVKECEELREKETADNNEREQDFNTIIDNLQEKLRALRKENEELQKANDRVV